MRAWAQMGLMGLEGLMIALGIAGCDATPTERVRDADTSEPMCEASATGVEVTLCGATFAIDDAGAFGISDVAHAATVVRVAARVGEHVVQLDGARLVVRAAALDGAPARGDLEPSGDVYLGWFASSLDVVSEERVVVQTGAGATFVDLDAAGVPSVSAVWRGATVLGADAGRIAIRVPGGFALVDVADPRAPVEVACAHGPAGVFGYDFPLRMQDGHLLVVDSASDDAWRAWLYDVDTLPIGAPLAIPGDAPTAVLHRDRLLVFPNANEDVAVLYQIEEGALEALARVDVPRTEPYSGNAVVGGMLALAGRYEPPILLIDLESDGANLYELVEARACGWVVAPVAGGPSLGLTPAGDPSARLAPDAVGDDCTAATTFPDRVDIIAREPGGTRALVMGDSWRWLDLATFEGTPATFAGPVRGTPYWVGDNLYMVQQTGSDWDMPMHSTIDVYDARDLGVAPRLVARDHTVWSIAAGDRLWFLSDPGVSIYGRPGPLDERQIWSLGADGTTIVEHPELDDLQPVALAAAGETLWVLDARGFVRRARGGVLDDSPRFSIGEMGEMEGMGGISEAGGAVLAASALGLFVADASPRLMWWVDAELTPHRFSTPADCLTRGLAAADDDYLYVLEQRLDDIGAPLESALVIGRPVARGEVFEMAPAAREPGAPRVFPGTPTLLLDGTQQRAVRVL